MRLDVPADGRMLWMGNMLSDQPLCSQRPLLNTSYPHVPISRAADYVLVDDTWRKPFDAVGPPFMTLDRYQLFRLKPNLDPARRPLLAQDGADRQEALRGRQGRRAVAGTPPPSFAAAGPSFGQKMNAVQRRRSRVVLKGASRSEDLVSDHGEPR